jgi:hypothetical protein
MAKLSSSVYRYVLGIYKGSGETLGNIAAQARSFESEMDTWNEEMNLREGLSG